MAGENRWNISLADLAVLVIGFAVSAATLRLTLGADLSTARVRFPKGTYYAGAAGLFLCPVGWTAAGLAMRRTARRRWVDHPVIVVGLATFVLTIVEAVLLFSFNPTSPVLSSAQRTILLGSALLTVVGRFLIAWVFIFFVVGRLRKPDDWLKLAGWLLGLGWVGGHVALFVARYF